MKRAIVIILCAGGILYVVSRFMPLRWHSPLHTVVDHKGSPLAQAPSPGKPSPAEGKLRRLFQGPRHASPSILSQTTVSPRCADLWERIHELDVREVFNPTSHELALPSDPLCGDIPENVRPFHEAYHRDCKELASSVDRGVEPTKKWSERASPCYMATIVYRAKITDWLTRSVPLNSIDDPRVLVDKLLSGFLSDPAGVSAIAERLVRLEPTVYPAWKALAISKAIATLDAKKGGLPTTPLWGDIELALNRAKELNPTDLDIEELQIVIEEFRSHDVPQVRTLSEELDQRHPLSGRGPYLLAWVEHQNGNRERALEFLREAIRREPNEHRYQTTLHRMISLTPGDASKIFQLVQTVSLDGLVPTL